MIIVIIAEIMMMFLMMMMMMTKIRMIKDAPHPPGEPFLLATAGARRYTGAAGSDGLTDHV